MSQIDYGRRRAFRIIGAGGLAALAGCADTDTGNTGASGGNESHSPIPTPNPDAPAPPAAFEDAREKVETGLNQGLSEDAEGVFPSHPDAVQEEEGGTVFLIYQGKTGQGGYTYDVRVAVDLDESIPGLAQHHENGQEELIEAVQDVAWHMVWGTHSYFSSKLAAHDDTRPEEPQIVAYDLRFTEEGSGHYAQHRVRDETVQQIFDSEPATAENWEQTYQELLRDADDGLQVH